MNTGKFTISNEHRDAIRERGYIVGAENLRLEEQGNVLIGIAESEHFNTDGAFYDVTIQEDDFGAPAITGAKRVA